MKKAVIISQIYLLFLVCPVVADGVTGGQLKCWHKVTLTFDGPQAGEQADPNPFMDYRLDVTFVSPTGRRFVVPGYYAADGNAAQTSAVTGNKWKVHLASNEVGTWKWSAGFRTGKNIAVSDASKAGEPMDMIEGLTGAFEVIPSDKTGRDFRAKGLLRYVGKHHLQFAGTKEYFLKCGVDAPENLLAYAEFDGSFKSDGIKDDLIKTWSPHTADWKPGDPTWSCKDGTPGIYGKGIIGALNYLASKDFNAVSFLPMNIEGDDRNVFPYTDYNERLRLDVSKLAQWEIVFDHAEQRGLFLHFKTQETENDQLLDGGRLGNERKLYYRELIARFGHHLALNWNLGEENTNTTEQIRQFCDFFKKHDPYHHPIVLHTYPDQKEKVYTPLLGDASGLSGLSLQTNFADFRAVHNDVLTWVQKSDQAGKPWVVSCDEPGDAEHALVPDADDPTHDNARMNALWAVPLAGGAGLEWYFGYKHAHSDLTCQDFRSRDQFWDQCKIMLDFFKDNNIPFWDMTSDDSLLKDTAGYCFQNPDQLYVVFLKTTESAKLTLPEGNYTIQWYNPRIGGPLQTGTVKTILGDGTVSLGTPPSEVEEDWVALLIKSFRS